ncbi:MAG: HAMP domain-containing histidine kinase [Oscillospiraceae bacterium]|nr:HAMP domain-containing histidine kinase [Oscillospiraceae bacterium]
MRKRIYYRNFATTAAVMLLSFVLLGCVFTAFSYRLVVQERRDAMSVTADEVVRTASSLAGEWNLSGLEFRMILSMSSTVSGYHIMLADPGGVVQSCSDRDLFCAHLGRSLPEGVMAELSEKGRFYGTTELDGLYSQPRYVTGRVISGEEGVVGYAILSGDPGSMSEIWRQSAGVFILVALIVMLLTFVLSLIATKKQAEPLNEMAEAANKFARGDFSVRVGDYGRQDEIGQLAHAFNAMADSLESSENRRREFIANVSHELKTPMTTISGFADGLLDGTIPREMQDQYLTVISSETKRLNRLVRGMLDMSHLQSADTAEILQKSFDVSEVIRVTLLGLESKICDHGLDVDAEIPEDPIVVRGDQDAITQVVYNLIDNAAKFAEEGSTLKIALWKQGGRAYVSVEDRGQDIPREELPLIFDRFHKTDRSRSSDKDGVGLGLYIVKTILDNHQEDIYVTSSDGVTKFIFTLTLAQQEKRPRLGGDRNASKSGE